MIAAYDGVRSWLYREAGPAVAAQTSAPSSRRPSATSPTSTSRPPTSSRRATPRPSRTTTTSASRSSRPSPRPRAADDRVEYQKEIVNSLAAAYQTGEYPPAKEALQPIIKGGGPLASYAAFRLIPAEYSLRARDPDEVVEAQKAWLADLREVPRRPTRRPTRSPRPSSRSPASRNTTATRTRPGPPTAGSPRSIAQTPSGRKAAGALKRLDLDGKPLELTGPGPDGQTIDANATKGKHLLVVFGAGNSSPTRRELPELSQLADRRKGDLAIIGVSLDADPAASTAFAQQSPWPTIVEPGGMDGRLAEGFGIISLPTMILVDEDGKVIDNDVRSIAEVEGHLDGAVAQKPEE